MPTSYELTYFDFTGRAEPIRIMLHAAGIEFKDTRLQRTEWSSHKPTTPLGSVPTLKIDDVTFCQSVALSRYAAKLAGFYPEDPLEALVVDEVIDTCADMMTTCPYAKDEEEKKAKRVEWQNGTLTKFSSLIESRIQSAGGRSVVESASIADVILRGIVENVKNGFFDYVDPNFFSNYPGIIATCDAIMENPKVKSYYESRK